MNILETEQKQYCTPENPFPDREADYAGYEDYLNEQEAKYENR